MTCAAPRVLVHSDVTAPLLESLRAAIPDVEAVGCETYSGLQSLVPQFRPDVVYSVRFDGSADFPRAVLLGRSGPRWISVGGSGCDHLGRWDPDRVAVTNAAGVAAPMMAEYVLGCFLNFTLDLPGLEQDKAARHWRPRRMTPLRGKTLLIVGLGQTGQAIAARAQAFGMTVLGTRARPAPTENVDEVFAPDALADLWARADMIAVCVPLLDSTRHLVGARAFATMKPTAIIADVSRGGVIDPEALVQAMRTGRIAGAALDVFETEPLPPDSPYWGLERTVLSPHCSAVYEGWDKASFDLFIDNLHRWRRGEPLRNVVDPARGY